MQGRTSWQAAWGQRRFKGPFTVAISLIVLASVCLAVWGFTDCQTSSVHFCTYWYSYYTYDCINFGTSYCCSSSYRYCGDSNCITKPYDYQACDGWLIAAWVLYFIGGIMAIVAICQYCAVRRMEERAAVYNQINPADPGPNVVIYQPQPAPPQPQYNPYGENNPYEHNPYKPTGNSPRKHAPKRHVRSTRILRAKEKKSGRFMPRKDSKARHSTALSRSFVPTRNGG